MPGNGKVFVSYPAKDSAHCLDLIAALDAWGVDYVTDTGQDDAVAFLPPAAQKAITERDVFIRVCTTNTPLSSRMNMEAAAFRISQANASGRQRSAKVFVNLILDPLYEREPFDNATLFIDGATRPRAAWIADLGRALGLHPAARVLTRRTFIGLGAAVAITVASSATAGITLAREQASPTHTSTVQLDLSRTPFVPRWQTRMRDGSPPGIAIAGTTLIAIGDTSSPTGTVGLNAATGKQLWSLLKVASYNAPPPAIAGNTAVAAIGSGTVYAFSLTNGQILWHTGLDYLNACASPAIASGLVFINGDDGAFVALDLKSGDTVWQKSFPANKSSLIEQLSTPATGGGLVYFGVVDGTLVALDAKSGTRKWKQATDGPIYSSPAYSDGTLYVGSTDNHVYAFRASDGKSLWKFQTGGDVISSPVVMDGVVYAGSSDKYLYALNATTGALFWSALIGDKDSAGTINHAGNGVLGKPAVSRAAQAVYVTSGGSLYGVRIRDGGRRGRFQSGGDEFAQMSSPVAADTLGLVYFGSGDGTLYAINL